MSRHPVTPADESDLRLHLGRQTNKRIALFLGQAGIGKTLDDGTRTPEVNFPTDLGILTPDGRKLLLSTLNYAAPVATTATPSLAVTRTGAGISISYSGGTLQSATAINGAWGNESSPSPVAVTPSGAAKFYRVKGT